MTVIDAPPQSPEQPRSVLSRLLGTPARIIAFGAAAVLLVDAGGTDDGPGICVFRRCTGGYCPGCGLTRSARHLSRGELSAAWHDHPWMVLVAAQMLVATVIYWFARDLRRRLATHRVALWVAGVNVALILGIWVYRLSVGSIPTFF